jgi:hypothetical protein
VADFELRMAVVSSTLQFRQHRVAGGVGDVPDATFGSAGQHARIAIAMAMLPLDRRTATPAVVGIDDRFAGRQT